MKKRSSSRKRFNFSVVLLPFMALCVIAGCLWYGWWLLHNADYFRVKEVIVRGEESADLTHLRARNIFEIDLLKETSSLLESYPDFSQVKMVRVLPDRIFVDFLKRNPVALVKLYKDFAIDAEGVLFYLLDDTKKALLPVIVGLETKIFGPKPGRQYTTKELSTALKIIRYSAMNPALQPYTIATIDLTHPSQTSFILRRAGSQEAAPESIEVRIGLDNIRQRISILSGLLRESNQDFGQITYIDLRFRDPVIKFKEDVS